MANHKDTTRTLLFFPTHVYVPTYPFPTFTETLPPILLSFNSSFQWDGNGQPAAINPMGGEW